MNKRLNKIISYSLLVGLVISSLSSLGLILVGGNQVHADDLMEKAFRKARESDLIINLGNNKESVGNETFEQGLDVDVNIGWRTCFVNGTSQDLNPMVCSQMGWVWDEWRIWTKKCNINGGREKLLQSDLERECEQLGGDWSFVDISPEPPLTVRITKFLLRITVALAITMIIYNAIKLIIDSAAGKEMKDSVKNIAMVAVGLLLALASVAIISLITSVSKSTLNLDDAVESISIRQPLTAFCQLADNDWNVAEQSLIGEDEIIHRTQTQLQVFCRDPYQPIYRTHLQMQRMMERITINNPFNRTIDQLNNMIKFFNEHSGDWDETKLRDLDVVLNGGTV